MSAAVRSAQDARGFTIVELLIASAIMLVVMGAVFSLVDPGQATYRTQPEVSEMQQNLRIAQNALYQDLAQAGAGPYLGSNAGSLLQYFSPLLPYRAEIQDPKAGVVYRENALTVMYVPQTTAQIRIQSEMPASSAVIDVTPEAGCPVGDALCSFDVGMRAVIFDISGGAYDVFTITQVLNSPTRIQHNLDKFSTPYPKDSVVTQIASNTYYLLANAATGTSQLMFSTGLVLTNGQTALPLVDNVVDLRFVYYGDPKGPVLLKPVTGAIVPGAYTTYGPKPPALGVDNTADPYPAGENCVFKIDAASGRQVSRLPDLSSAPGLVPVTAAMLQDGPWCPNTTDANRFDADMLRVRRVEARLRVQVASAALRGPAGTLFRYGGTSSGGARFVPDQELRFDVTPRNMNLGR